MTASLENSLLLGYFWVQNF